ncbi:MAG: class I SAM-dependent methyltransferase [Acidimicrobiia bacterium]|nr:class I SAM-dependent methyltransferase [Acidimicrobiia bacterium]
MLDDDELAEMFDAYTSTFPWADLPEGAVGFDAGCGSGRWARFFAPKVKLLHCVDASAAAIEVARSNLNHNPNVKFHHADLTNMDIPDGSCDFGYSLGVLHHVPDTAVATRSCAMKLKPGAPFLVYLYYNLEGAGLFRRALLRAVSGMRYAVARLPRPLKTSVADLIAAIVYLPLARLAGLIDRRGGDPSWVPLFQYRNRSFYVMRNDSLDRFGTRLEKRFSREEVRQLLEDAGLERVTFAPGPPWWVATAWKPVSPPVGEV